MADWVKYFEKTRRSIFDRVEGTRRLIELVIDQTPKGGRILEAGCGTAVLSIILADYGFDVTALDYSQEVLDYAKERLFLNKIRLKFIQGDILKLSALFGNQHFDTICHSGVMEHFKDEDIVASLSEQRIISKKVIFAIPNNRIKNTSGMFGDERLMGNQKWVSLIKAAGFGTVKVYGGYDLPRFTYFLLPGAFFHRRGSFWWKHFSKHSIFVCE